MAIVSNLAQAPRCESGRIPDGPTIDDLVTALDTCAVEINSTRGIPPEGLHWLATQIVATSEEESARFLSTGDSHALPFRADPGQDCLTSVPCLRKFLPVPPEVPPSEARKPVTRRDWILRVECIERLLQEQRVAAAV
jgi:hypothetical protein